MGQVMHAIRMIERRIFFPGFIVIYGIGAITNDYADWKQVGLKGKEVTAITKGIDLFSNQQIILVGTKDTGVYSVSGAGDTVYRYPRYSDASDKPAGRIRTLFTSADGIMTFAGTDSGLYGESGLFSSLPAWRKLQTFPSEPVVGIAYKDSTYYVATAIELYRSKSPWAYSNAWKPCSVSKWLPSPERSPHFTSLTSWDLGGLVAGSNASAGSDAFGGVITGGGSENRWIDWTCVNSHCVDSDVYSLTFGFQQLYAGTSRGVFNYSTANEIGIWYEMTPQLASPPARHICVTSDSITHAREIYASTDSGVYALSPRVNANQWTLSLKVKAFAVASLAPDNSNAVYAATADGVWKYESTTGIGAGRAAKIPTHRAAVTGVYSINGRKMASEIRSMRMTGVFIILQQTGTCKRIFTGMKNRP
jgi:hypothetical protein